MDPHPLSIHSALFFLLQCKTRLDTNTSVLSCPSQQKDNYTTIIIEIQKKEEKRKYEKADTKKNKLGGPPTHKHFSTKLSSTAKRH